MSLAGAWKQLRWSSDYGQGPEDCSKRTDQQWWKPVGRTCWVGDVVLAVDSLVCGDIFVVGIIYFFVCDIFVRYVSKLFKNLRRTQFADHQSVQPATDKLYVTRERWSAVRALKFSGTGKLFSCRRLRLRSSFFPDWPRVAVLTRSCGPLNFSGWVMGAQRYRPPTCTLSEAASSAAKGWIKYRKYSTIKI